MKILLTMAAEAHRRTRGQTMYVMINYRIVVDGACASTPMGHPVANHVLLKLLMRMRYLFSTSEEFLREDFSLEMLPRGFPTRVFVITIDVISFVTFLDAMCDVVEFNEALRPWNLVSQLAVCYITRVSFTECLWTDRNLQRQTSATTSVKNANQKMKVT